MKKYRFSDLSNEAKANVIENNRNINLIEGWDEDVINSLKNELINIGFQNPEIIYSFNQNPADGAFFTSAESFLSMLNEDIKNHGELTAGFSDEKILDLIVEKAKNGESPVKVFVSKNSNYILENSSEANIEIITEERTIEEIISETFVEWEICGSAVDEYDSLVHKGILVSEVAGKIIYGVNRDAVSDSFNTFKINNGTITRDNIIKKYEEWNLIANEEFERMVSEAAVSNSPDIDGLFRELNFSDQVSIISKFITFEKLLGEESKRRYSLDDIIEMYNPLYVGNMLGKISELGNVLEENMNAWIHDKNAEIFNKIKEVRDELTSDSAVEDTLEINDPSFYDEEGNIYDPEKDKTYSFEELSTVAKNKVSERYFKIYDFLDINRDYVDFLQADVENKGFKFDKRKLKFVNTTYPYYTYDGTLEISNFQVAKNALGFEGYNSESEINQDLLTQMINNFNVEFKTKLENETREKYSIQTSQSAISEFYEGQKFDAEGNDIDDVE